MNVGDVLQSCSNVQAPPFRCPHHLNAYGAAPPRPVAVNVTAVPGVLGLARSALTTTPVIAGDGDDVGGGGVGDGAVDVLVVGDVIRNVTVPIACATSAVAPELRPQTPSA